MRKNYIHKKEGGRVRREGGAKIREQIPDPRNSLIIGTGSRLVSLNTNKYKQTLNSINHQSQTRQPLNK